MAQPDAVPSGANPRNLESGARISPTKVKTAFLALVVSGAAMAQIYPPTMPGQSPYPYPGQRRPTTGVPMPGKTSKSDKNDKNKANQPLPNFRGQLKLMDEKTISVQLGDDRVLDFKRNGSTKFFKMGDEVKTPKFNTGDQVSVEAQEEPGGYLTAVNVYWEKAAGGAASKPEDTSTVDTWKDVPKMSTDKPAGTEQRVEAPPAVADAPIKPAADDPGPPRLRRGGAADPSREKSAAVPDLPPGDSAPVRIAPPNEERVTVMKDTDEDASPYRAPPGHDDPLIRRAADTALEFTETLPSYVCTEMIARYYSDTNPANFHPMDVMSVDVVYENGREDYRNLQINGKPTKKKMEESGGAWSTGEFGTVLINLFNPATGAKFHFRRDSRAGNVLAKMYDFEVAKENSHWEVGAGSQKYLPAYSGSIWIDPKTARVLRIEMEGKGFPSDFPLDHVESATDYANVRLGDLKEHLLPVHSEILSCERGSNNCSRNVIDFRNYHKYSGESTITFGDSVKK
jgi:hypothetical protein